MATYCMRIACWIPKATNTHSEYVILLFHSKSGYTNAPECNIIRTLPVLLKYIFNKKSLVTYRSYRIVVGRTDIISRLMGGGGCLILLMYVPCLSSFLEYGSRSSSSWSRFEHWFLLRIKERSACAVHVTALALCFDLTETCLRFGLLTAQVFISCGIWAT